MPTGKCTDGARIVKKISIFVTNVVRIGSSKVNQWMLNLGGNFGKEQGILHGFKISSHGLLIGCQREYIYYTVETTQHPDQVL